MIAGIILGLALPLPIALLARARFDKTLPVFPKGSDHGNP